MKIHRPATTTPSTTSKIRYRARRGWAGLSMVVFVLVGLLVLALPPHGARANGARVKGHMKPLAEELLEKPMRLECGVVVTEWRGYEHDEELLQRLCSLAQGRFLPFIESKGLKTEHRRAFRWSAALLPNGTCYRCLNDEQWRFAKRAAQGKLTGYTSFTNRYSFVLGNPQHREFEVTVVHELFHAQSFFYGVFDRHADNDADRVRIDESLAVEFTESLGLGR